MSYLDNVMNVIFAGRAEASWGMALPRSAECGWFGPAQVCVPARAWPKPQDSSSILDLIRERPLLFLSASFGHIRDTV